MTDHEKKFEHFVISDGTYVNPSQPGPLANNFQYDRNVKCERIRCDRYPGISFIKASFDIQDLDWKEVSVIDNKPNDTFNKLANAVAQSIWRNAITHMTTSGYDWIDLIVDVTNTDMIADILLKSENSPKYRTGSGVTFQNCLDFLRDFRKQVIDELSEMQLKNVHPLNQRMFYLPYNAFTVKKDIPTDDYMTFGRVHVTVDFSKFKSEFKYSDIGSVYAVGFHAINYAYAISDWYYTSAIQQILSSAGFRNYKENRSIAHGIYFDNLSFLRDHMVHKIMDITRGPVSGSDICEIVDAVMLGYLRTKTVENYRETNRITKMKDATWERVEIQVSDPNIAGGQPIPSVILP